MANVKVPCVTCGRKGRRYCIVCKKNFCRLHLRTHAVVKDHQTEPTVAKVTALRREARAS